MLRISDPAALEAWLGERNGFEDGHLARAERSPGGAVTLVLENYLRFGPRPGDVSVVEVVRLVADEVTVEHVVTERRVTEPWVSDEFTVVTGAAHDARFWTDGASRALGTPVVWRILGGREPREAGASADGCFLQTLSRLPSTDHGVFCARWSGGRYTTLRRYGSPPSSAGSGRATVFSTRLTG
ncbi:hypothetical protein [Amycolatopsis suaedae]|uniref:Uncharacterized protein n=1 Tax=Amycolatopsis suaedae TaxID=2510978 RepID=A0A4Q7J1C7_9PSEU|nr:hypothetical protein [Amycolatopsis suaedae]RZQ61201.1 hypothetical protein EWH70_25330 [Amycolatopsis suaedae]